MGSAQPLRPSSAPDEAKFTLSPKLAPELQDFIWSLALPGPRTINVSSPCIEPQPGRHRELLNTNRSSIPTSLLHTCFRSREIALLKYKRSFANSLESPIYFDPNDDTLYLSDSEAGYYFLLGNHLQGSRISERPEGNTEWNEDLRHVAVDGDQLRSVVMAMLSFNKSLETLVIFRSPLSTHLFTEEEIRVEFQALWEKNQPVEVHSRVPSVTFTSKD